MGVVWSAVGGLFLLLYLESLRGLKQTLTPATITRGWRAISGEAHCGDGEVLCAASYVLASFSGRDRLAAGRVPQGYLVTSALTETEVRAPAVTLQEPFLTKAWPSRGLNQNICG